MAKIDQLIQDIHDLKREANRRSAHRIHQILEGHKKQFSEKIDPDYIELALKNFEELSEAHSNQLANSSFMRDYEKHYESLVFHLNRIL